MNDSAANAGTGDVVRIANCSGFFGDRLAAAREMVDGGPIDVLTGDWLAELTMLILWRTKLKHPDGGYARTFLRQMEDVLGTCTDRGIKVVSNAGGLNPAALAEKLEDLNAEIGAGAKIACIEGDDILGRLDELQAAGHDLTNLDTGEKFSELGADAATANAYLGGWGIAAALDAGADIVVTGRVTDAALVIGPAAAHFGWARDDWDELAGALIAGHVIECGAQTTGGNYAFFDEVPGLDHVGFPIAEVADDGSATITKHPGTGGLVSVGTVTAQLVYEIAGPRYFNPDVTARFDSIRLEDAGPDRVRIVGVKGEPPPPTTKVAINYLAGFRNSAEFVLTGLDIEAKSAAAESALFAAIDGGRDSFDDVSVELIRSDQTDPPSNDAALAYLRVTVKDADPNKIGRKFANTGVELALASYPGYFATSPPGDASPFGVYWPATVPAEEIHQVVNIGNERIVIDPVLTDDAGRFDARIEAPAAAAGEAAVRAGETRRLPLGTIIGARSGDKGGNANVGVWAGRNTGEDGYAWLAGMLTVEKFRELIPESSELEVERFEYPNILALNFVVHGLLGRGVAETTRTDAQAKGLGEYLRAKLVDVPVALLGR